MYKFRPKYHRVTRNKLGLLPPYYLVPSIHPTLVRFTFSLNPFTGYFFSRWRETDDMGLLKEKTAEEILSYRHKTHLSYMHLHCAIFFVLLFVILLFIDNMIVLVQSTSSLNPFTDNFFSHWRETDEMDLLKEHYQGNTKWSSRDTSALYVSLSWHFISFLFILLNSTKTKKNKPKMNDQIAT